MLLHSPQKKHVFGNAWIYLFSNHSAYSETRTNHFHTNFHNTDKSQEWASRWLTTTDTSGLQTTGPVQIARNSFSIIINEKNSVTSSNNQIQLPCLQTGNKGAAQIKEILRLRQTRFAVDWPPTLKNPLYIPDRQIVMLMNRITHSGIPTPLIYQNSTRRAFHNVRKYISFVDTWIG